MVKLGRLRGQFEGVPRAEFASSEWVLYVIAACSLRETLTSLRTVTRNELLATVFYYIVRRRLLEKNLVFPLVKD